MKSAVSRSPNY